MKQMKLQAFGSGFGRLILEPESVFVAKFVTKLAIGRVKMVESFLTGLKKENTEG